MDSDETRGSESAAGSEAPASGGDLVSRRSFVVWLAATSLGTSFAFATVTVGRGVQAPARSIEGKTKVGPLAVATVDELEPETPLLREYGDDVVFVVKKADDTLLVMDAACPHVACKLSWNDASGEFDCPCHDSSFSIDGTLLGGPAPRDMYPATFEVSDAGEVVVSGFERA